MRLGSPIDHFLFPAFAAAILLSCSAAWGQAADGFSADSCGQVPEISRAATAGENPEAIDPLSAPRSEPSLETRVEGSRLVLDWSSSSARTPARFRVLKPDGRMVAARGGKRSVQGWIASLRVAGWPRGSYYVEVESGPARVLSRFLLP